MQALVVTDKGKALIAALLGAASAVEGAQTVSFTRIETADHDYSGVELEQLERLDGARQSAPVSDVSRNGDSTVTVTAAVDNKDLPNGYYVRAVGLYARNSGGDEILFGVSVETENPDYLPVFGGRSASAIAFRFVIKVDSAERVSVEVNPAASPTIQQVEDVRTAANNALAAAERAAAAISVPVAFTLAASAWSALGTPRAGCNYAADIIDSSVSAKDSVRVDFDENSIEKCAAAKVSAAVTTYDGKMTLFAKNPLTSAVSGFYIVTKGAV